MDFILELWNMEEIPTNTEEEEDKREEEQGDEDPIYALAPTISIRDERSVDLSTSPAFICLHEVFFYLLLE